MERASLRHSSEPSPAADTMSDKGSAESPARHCRRPTRRAGCARGACRGRCAGDADSSAARDAVVGYTEVSPPSLVALGLAAGAALWRRPPTPAVVTHLTLDAAPADEISTTSVLGMLPAGGRLALAWSPTGHTLAFVGSRPDASQIYLRDLSSGEARRSQGPRAPGRLLTRPMASGSRSGREVNYGRSELLEVRPRGSAPPPK